MALKVGELVAYMDIDNRGFDRKLDEGQSKFNKAGSFISGKAALLAGAVGLSFAAVGTATFDRAIQLEAMGKKAKIVFGEEIAMVETWAKANAAGMGLTKNEAMGVAANFADLLVPMGFARDQAATMSTEVIGLSGALAEWSGGQLNATQVADILAKAMLGEREGLKQVGIAISEADIQQRLLEKGQQDLTGAALAQAEAMATQELIFEKSKDAQTAYAGSTDDLASKKANLTAKLKEVWDTVSVKIVPVMSTLLDIFSVMIDIILKVGDAVLKVFGKGWLWGRGKTQEDYLSELKDTLKAAGAPTHVVEQAVAAGATKLTKSGGTWWGTDAAGRGVYAGKQQGGLVTQPGLYPLAEDKGPELVMPLTKPRRMQELAGQYLGMDSGVIVAAIDALIQRFDNYEAQRRADLRDIRLGMAY